MPNPTSEPFDVVIVGSGAGGSAAAWQLARAGFRVAVVEKGGPLPRDGSTLDFQQVVRQGAFKSRDRWLDRHGRQCVPEEYFNLGGKTKWFGAALLRFGRHEFGADSTYQCPAWPIDYEDIVPYYEVAERLLRVQNFEPEADLQRIADRIAPATSAWRHESLPMGLSPNITTQPREAKHLDGFAGVAGLKFDAESAFLEPALKSGNLTLSTGRAVIALVGERCDPTRLAAVRLDDGAEIHGRVIMLAAGALHSPRLIQDYLEHHGLTDRLPSAQQVGRHLKMQMVTATIAAATRPITDLLRKTLIFFNADLPHSSVQPQGLDGEVLSYLMPRIVPTYISRFIGDRAYGFFLQTEDGSHPDNRVTTASADSPGLAKLDYDPARLPASVREHERLVRRFRAAMAGAGFISFARRMGITGTAHVSGTLIAGRDPARSVVDAEGRVHGLKSLCVVDGSILPRSGRVNPSLTIFAWALRTADHLAQRLIKGNVLVHAGLWFFGEMCVRVTNEFYR